MNLSSTILDSKAKPVRIKLRVSTQRKKKRKGKQHRRKNYTKTLTKPWRRGPKISIENKGDNQIIFQGTLEKECIKCSQKRKKQIDKGKHEITCKISEVEAWISVLSLICMKNPNFTPMISKLSHQTQIETIYQNAKRWQTQGSIAMYEFISEGTKKSVGLDCGNVNFTKCQKKNSKKAKKGKLQGKRNPKGEKKK